MYHVKNPSEPTDLMVSTVLFLDYLLTLHTQLTLQPTPHYIPAHRPNTCSVFFIPNTRSSIHWFDRDKECPTLQHLTHPITRQLLLMRFMDYLFHAKPMTHPGWLFPLPSYFLWRAYLLKLEAMTYKRWSFTESMVISPTLTALMSCLSSSLAAPEVPFCLSSSVLLALLPTETRSNRATICKCSDKRTIIQYTHCTLTFRHHTSYM